MELNFNVDGFPMWLMILALIAAGIKLSAHFKSEKGVLHSFDRDATLPLRGVLVAIVMLGHLKAHCTWGTPWIPWVGWQTPAVAVFFFLSGYGLCKCFDARGIGYLNGFVPRSLKKLIVPLLPVVLVYLVYLFSQGALLSSIIQFIKGGNTPVPNTWYVYALSLMYVLWCGAWLMSSNKYVRLALLWIGVLVYFIIMEFVLDWHFVWARTIFAFPLGVTFATVEKKLQDKIRMSPLCFYVSATLTLLAALLIRSYFPGKAIAIAGRGLTSTMGLWVVLVWYAFSVPSVGWLRFLGGISYELYLVHGLVMIFLLPILKNDFFVFTGSVIIISICLAFLQNRLDRFLLGKFK